VRVAIYTDGGADPNPGYGGWAAILRSGGRERVLQGSAEHTTNNRMELTAAIRALEALKRPVEVDFHTDSEYLRQGITKWIDAWAEASWRRKGREIPNTDLWQRLWSLSQEHAITWHWVKGHSGDPLNDRVDRLAREARLAITPSEFVSPDSPRMYARGACRGNPGPGAWGIVLEEDGKTEQFSGTELNTTNNRMELLAVIEGLRLLPRDRDVQIVTTSDYVFQGATRWIRGWRQRGWKKRGGQPISNLDLWQALDRLTEGRQVRWINGKGQPPAYSRGLEEAGRLATGALEVI
jgi:ribonuclease HI